MKGNVYLNINSKRHHRQLDHRIGTRNSIVWIHFDTSVIYFQYDWVVLQCWNFTTAYLIIEDRTSNLLNSFCCGIQGTCREKNMSDCLFGFCLWLPITLFRWTRVQDKIVSWTVAYISFEAYLRLRLSKVHLLPLININFPLLSYARWGYLYLL